jgi:aspartate aminotransferase-like enzyme
MQYAMEKMNITPERILAPINDALDDDDVRTRLMGSDRAIKAMQIAHKDTSTGSTNIFVGNSFNSNNYVED